ncbi:MAG: flagellar hook-associated protein FlgK [Thiotrichales bacterium]
MESIKIAYSALQTSQRAIATTSHNIANANTEGYSRQRVELATKPPEVHGGQFYGTGAFVERVQRLADQFIETQMREVGAENGRLNVFTDFTARIDNLLAQDSTSIGTAIQDFFNAIEALNVDPASVPLRQELMSRAENLAGRFGILDTRMEGLTQEINNRIRANVEEINTLSTGIAEMNRKIAVSASQIGGAPPGDLVDARGVLIQKLATLTGGAVVDTGNHMVNVFAGSGVNLVVGSHSERLVAIENPFDPSKSAIALANNGTPINVTHLLGKGEIGGLMTASRDLIEPVRNELGQLALTLADAVNEQHAKGMDLNGQFGGTFFKLGEAQTFTRGTNTGTGAVTATITDTRQITASDYELYYDGTNYTLTRLADNQNQIFATLPASADGFELTLTGVVAAGDAFRIRPAVGASRAFGLEVNDLNKIALASPLRSDASLSNTGSVKATAPGVTDATHPNLLNTVELRFTTANTFDVLDTTSGATLAAGLAFSDGMTLAYNGWQTQLSGIAAPGDAVTLARNTSGVGDNKNGTALAALQNQLIVGGKATFSSDYGSLVSRVGNITRQAQISLESQQTLLQQTQDRRDSVSGVNLDEEAINLTRYQQTYNAAAQMIATSNQLFNSILSIFR